MQDKPNYLPRLRICGQIEWLCPECGTINKTRVMFTQPIPLFECVAKECAAKYRVSAILRQRVRETLPNPVTVFEPPDVFPLVTLERANWQRDNQSVMRETVQSAA